MHRFTVAVEDFYRHFHEDPPRVRACMEELIDRYRITGKSILSVGAGEAFEEKYFALAGNDLTLIDIDEGGTLRRNIPKFPSRPGLTYLIDDAAGLLAEVGPQDVVYFSGFTPDETRRAELVRQNGETLWKLEQDPFHPVVMEYADKLRPGGLLIVQSYCGGIDAGHNANYVDACIAQLGRHDFHLMEVHRFRPSIGIMLYCAVKAERRRAPDAPMAAFHGRAELEEVERIYPVT
jgi:SAM-dependent methyltransferase